MLAVLVKLFGLPQVGVAEDIVQETLLAALETWKLRGMVWAGHAGLWLLWIAAALTLITGAEYLIKALPHLKDER